ncbi:post-segregation antitoxin CcdA [Herbihabitans rhizosphaerae]|uniref:Post-segregation antitoxin CcdA n=1 Tax=Herbihabitans rhizosphaerae TaxID=1872711 RepID=A0A4Q7L629_9PSEU|nr:type II toxin-antitoxin system CcdA family antitoxin [Herbihabitans rhizosphaerae]RZS45129.1 post-segregation antitoxin CcdA [Herbihabitans rhizosphaerae]
MAKRKITVTVDEELVDQARELGETHLSAVVNKALADHLDHLARLDAMRQMLDEWDAKFGPVPEEELASARATLDELDGVASDRGAA